MQNTAYGTYRDGQIFLDDAPSPVIHESRVQVIFLNKKPNGNSLMDIFSVLGPWEDNRDADAIIAEIRNARVPSPDICL
ncbi:MAG: hypothetical protein FWF87_07310 [Synergistaceae bacterium]|nr:hypothetical protein [Synergistaceae bacterium]